MEEDAAERVLPMNCISWNVRQLAWQEQKYYLFFGRGQLPSSEIDNPLVMDARRADFHFVKCSRVGKKSPTALIRD